MKEELILPNGLSVTFLIAPRANIDEATFISLKEQRQIVSDKLLHQRLSSGPGQLSPLLVQNNGGSWLAMAARASRIGVPHLYVWQPTRTAITSTDTRVIMVADETKLAFLPNYKCGYSSMYRFFAEAFLSCKTKADATNNQSSAFNVLESVRTRASDFIFTFVREPAGRFASFYLDKLCRGPKHHNYTDFRQVYETLMGNSYMSPWSVLKLVSSIPHAFSDRHWLPMYENTFYEDEPLVHAVYDIRKSDTFIHDVSAYLQRDVGMPHVLATDKIAAPAERDVLTSEEFRATVREKFSKDVRFYERVAAANGVLYFG